MSRAGSLRPANGLGGCVSARADDWPSYVESSAR